MGKRKRLTIKDKITIFIKKQKEHSPYRYILVTVILMVTLVMSSFADKSVEVKKAPEILTGDNISLRVTVAGEITIDDYVRKFANKIGYKNLFRGVSKYWRSSDTVIANVNGPALRYDESHYTSRREKGETTLYVRPAFLRGILAANINLPSFATDHAFDYGVTGLRSTIDLLNEYEMDYLGILSNNDEQLYKLISYEATDKNGEVEERNIAVISINDDVVKYSTAKPDREGVVNSSMGNIYEQVFEASENADAVIAYVHFSESSGMAEDTRTLSRELIAAGATVVVGNNGKTMEAERYKDGLIIYGIGSLVSSDTSSIDKDSVLVDFVIDDKGEANVFLTPLRIQKGRPVVTESKLYINRIVSKITRGLDKDDYDVLDDGIIQIKMREVK
jgi:poly-gamma-glutamate synthesis protein (capsule biosynthesis protein)